MSEEAVTIRELAVILGVHPQTVWSKAKNNDIPGFRVGRAWRFFPSEVKASLQAPSDPFVRRARKKAA